MKSLIPVLLAVGISAGCVYSSPRQALIIGNDNYPGNVLKNARNDANAIAEVLASLGYKTTLQLDADRKTMDDTITTFADGLNSGDIALVYYSGHGLQVDGENYLVPIDFHISTADDVPRQGYSLSAILQKLANRGARSQVIILDACRDNPFLRDRSLRNGWASPATPEGIFLAFGTAPGSTASDNPGAVNGLFTQALLRYLKSSDLEVEQLFAKVREDVARESNGLQVPWVASGLIGTLHLIPQLDSTPVQGTPSIRTGLVSPNLPGPRSVVTKREGQPNNASVNTLVQQGLLLVEQQNYQEAVRSLSAALAIDPHCSIALRVIALIFHILGRSTDAMSEIDQALLADPGDPLPYYYRCLIALPNDPASAIRDCEAAVGLQPSFAPAHIELSNALLMLGQTGKAYTEAKTAILLDPNSALAYSMLGKVEASLGNYPAAQQDYAVAVRLSTSERSQ